jgi:membrane protease YdiL (CAAX protease family)
MLWATLHLQYDLFGMLIVGIFGVMLCVARIKSNSLLLPVLMHAVYNGTIIGFALL